MLNVNLHFDKIKSIETKALEKANYIVLYAGENRTGDSITIFFKSCSEVQKLINALGDLFFKINQKEISNYVNGIRIMEIREV